MVEKVRTIYENISFLIESSQDRGVVERVVGKSLTKAMLEYNSNFNNPDGVKAKKEQGAYFSKELQEIIQFSKKQGELNDLVEQMYFHTLKSKIELATPKSKLARNLAQKLKGRNDYSSILGSIGDAVINTIMTGEKPRFSEPVTLDKKTIEKGKGTYKTIFSEYNKIFNTVVQLKF